MVVVKAVARHAQEVVRMHAQVAARHVQDPARILARDHVLDLPGNGFYQKKRSWLARRGIEEHYVYRY